MSTRWIAYRRPDGHRAVECRERSQVSGIVDARHAEGCTEIKVYRTADAATAALKPAPSQQEQAEVLVGGLVTSVALCKRGRDAA